ncbi:MAG: 3-oxoacyl-ACP synthase III family protein [Myxococcota bacterium]
MTGVTIVGTGRYAPGKPVTNAALTRVMDTSDEWIRQRTGIHQRHYAPEGVGPAELGHEASVRALEAAGIEAADVDYILFATMTPDYPFPGSGGLLGARLGIPGVPALDIRQQCCAMPFGLQVADGLVASGAARTVLLVGAEAHAGFMPWEDWDLVFGEREGEPSPEAWARATRHRGLAVLFGDGAGAMVLRQSSTEGHGFLGAELHSDGNQFNGIYVEGGSFMRRPYWTREMLDDELHIPQMQGRDLFKKAATLLPQTVRQLCDRHGYTVEDVDCFVAHQANDRINSAVRQALGLSPEKVPSNIARYGNTSAGTIPILTDELVRDGRIDAGDLVCFLALGAGLHWGAALMRV